MGQVVDGARAIRRKIVGPLGGNELSAIARPPAQPRAGRPLVDQQHVAHEGGRRGGGAPSRDALRVLGPVAALHGGSVHAQADERADELDVEVFGEGDGGMPQRPLVALTFGVAHLADPAVLKDSEDRKENQGRSNEPGDAGRAPERQTHSVQV